jgi:hypothetical protein
MIDGRLSENGHATGGIFSLRILQKNLLNCVLSLNIRPSYGKTTDYLFDVLDKLVVVDSSHDVDGCTM